MKLYTFSVALALSGPLAVLAAPSWLNRLVGRGQDTQPEYDEDSVSFEQQGLCRDYLTLAVPTTTSVSTCGPHCGNLVAQAQAAGNVSSVSCVSAGGGDIFTDPQGNPYEMGECVCDIPLLDQIVEDVILALPAIAQIGCEIMFDSLDDVLKIGALAIPGVGEEMDAGMEAAVKAAKTILKAGKKGLDFFNWLDHPCGTSNYTQYIDQIFDPLSSVSDAVMPA